MMSIPLGGSYWWSPDRWTASSRSTDTFRPEVGQILAWRYATWRVVEVRVRGDADLTDEDRQALTGYKPEYRDQKRPYTLVLRHERGPVLVEKPQTLHDGSKTVHLGVKAAAHHRWHVLDERYALCVCHGHPYPCQDFAAERIAEDEAERMGRLLDSHAPGVCASCREPITTRAKSLTFPEPSVLVPGAPGPTYHANRWQCWRSARMYELDKRLPAYPNAVRIASCPGLLFVHEAGGWEECTAERLCTGHHGPKGRRGDLRCYTRSYVAANGGGYPRPPSDCGYRQHNGCLGADPSFGAPDQFSIGDEFDRPYRSKS